MIITCEECLRIVNDKNYYSFCYGQFYSHPYWPMAYFCPNWRLHVRLNRVASLIAHFEYEKLSSS